MNGTMNALGGESGESDRVEFTASTTDLDKVRQAICAFANDLPGNGEPGLLFIGLEDDGRCAGSTIGDDLLKTLGGLRTDGKILPFPFMQVAGKRLGDRDVAVVQVEPSDNPPVKVDGRCWIRIGPRRSQATAEEERRLTEKRRWGNLSYDMRGVPGATAADDLDMRAFENDYLPCAGSPEVLAENRRDRGEQLRALRLVARNGEPTVTAILVLGRDPRYWLPGAYLQFVRYGGAAVTDEVLDQAELSGPLPQQLRDVDRLLKQGVAQGLAGPRREEAGGEPSHVPAETGPRRHRCASTGRRCLLRGFPRPCLGTPETPRRRLLNVAIHDRLIMATSLDDYASRSTRRPAGLPARRGRRGLNRG